jgi:glutathione peroxidase
MAKVKVNGDEAAVEPLYTFLKKKAPGFLGTTAVKWNFTKFLCDGDGAVLERFGPTTTPVELEPAIRKLLGHV